MNNITIGRRILILMFVSGLLLLAVAAIGWRNQGATVESLKSVYEHRAVALRDLARLHQLLAENTKEVLVTNQHDPKGTLHAVHHHSISVHMEPFAQRRTEIGQLWASYTTMKLGPDERALADDFASKHMRWMETSSRLMERMQGGDFSPELTMEFLQAELTLSRPANEALARLMAFEARIAGEEYSAAKQRHERGAVFYLLLLIGGLSATGIFATYLGRSITAPLAQVVDIAESIAGGDLTRVVPVGGRDEAGRLLAAFARMQASLRELATGMLKNSGDLLRAAEGLWNSADHAASAADAQSQEAAGMAASVEEMSVSIEQIRDHAGAANRIATEAGNASRVGGQVVQSAAEGMRKVAETVNAAATSIHELEDYSHQISAIINVIREVADQTNLLALNAAIEAARAGDQGRGFAVVADEVRKLAERTAESTLTIANVIGKVQSGAQRATREMETSVARVSEGVGLAGNAGDSITDIQRGASEVTAAVGDIGVALNEQSAAAQSIAGGVERIAQMSEETSVSVRQTVTSTQQLRELAGELERTVGRFRL